MNTITLSPLGEIDIKPPSDLLLASDVVLAWSSAAGERNRQARVSAAAIGICWARDGRDRPPRYDLGSGALTAYGGTVLRWLMERRVSPWTVHTAGVDLVVELSGMIPSDEEIDDAEKNSDSTASAQSNG